MMTFTAMGPLNNKPAIVYTGEYVYVCIYIYVICMYMVVNYYTTLHTASEQHWQDAGLNLN